MTTTKSPEPFLSKVTDPIQIDWHRVYIVQQPFYGRDPNEAGKLREYSRTEVEAAVMKTLGITKEFVEPSIGGDTTLLIVPDHWNRVLPSSVRQYSKNLTYLPFSYILYPKVTDPTKMSQVEAPPDAAFRVLEEKRNAPVPKDSYVMERIAPNKISEAFQGFLYASAKRMQPMRMNAAAKSMAVTTTPNKPTTTQGAAAPVNKPTMSKERQRERSVERDARKQAQMTEKEAREKAKKELQEKKKLAKEAQKMAKKTGKLPMAAATRSMYAVEDDDEEDNSEDIESASSSSEDMDDDAYNQAWADLRANIAKQKA